MEAIRQAIEVYKKIRQEQKEKSRLLNTDLDYKIFQKLLNSLADDPQKIKIIIRLTNGAVIELAKQDKPVPAMRDPYMERIE